MARKKITAEEYARLCDLLTIMRTLDAGVDQVYERMKEIVGEDDPELWLCECCFNEKTMTVDDLLGKVGLQVPPELSTARDADD